MSGALRCSKAAIPHLKEQGYGRIINISGGNARNAGNLSGGARNVSMVHMTKTLSNDLGRYGITVNCIHPGTTRTERTAGMLESRAAREGVTAAEVEEQGLRARLRPGQRHLPHGGRRGNWLRHRLPRLRQGLGRNRRSNRRRRRRGFRGVLLGPKESWIPLIRSLSHDPSVSGQVIVQDLRAGEYRQKRNTQSPSQRSGRACLCSTEAAVRN